MSDLTKVNKWPGLTKGDPLIEALTTLIMDLSSLLARDWNDIPSQDIKAGINKAIARALTIAI